jgi:hypothetical protein
MVLYRIRRYLVKTKKPIIRADNRSQYTSNAFRKSMLVLGLKPELIACNTPEQTLKKEHI